jgi:hypothetical protein
MVDIRDRQRLRQQPRQQHGPKRTPVYRSTDPARPVRDQAEAQRRARQHRDQLENDLRAAIIRRAFEVGRLLPK